MDSNQIKAALKPMVDFAPAIVRAGEIVKAVEDAEKRNKDLAKEITAKQSQLDALGSVEDAWKAKDAKAQHEHEQMVEGLAKQRAELTAGLKGLKDQIAAKEQELREVVNAKNKAIEDLNSQLESQRSVLGKVRAEIDRLKKTFAA